MADGRDDGRRVQRVLVHCRMRPRLAPSPDAGAATLPVAEAGSSSFAYLDEASSTMDFVRDGPGSSSREPVIPGAALPEPKLHRFVFDSLATPSATQEQVYRSVGEGIVNDVLQGYNGTILAYGQTGTGKTHTMLGPSRFVSAWEPAFIGDSGGATAAAAAASGGGASAGASIVTCPPEHRGVIPRALDQIFAAVDRDRRATSVPFDFTVLVSYVQIYCELIHDLLVPDPTAASLAVREDPNDGVYVEGACQVPVTSTARALELLAAGNRARAVASTQLNAHSSRSHAIFMVRVEKRRREEPVSSAASSAASSAPSSASSSTSSSSPAPLPVAKLTRGTLFLVDLAGSERATKSGVVGVHMSELKAINLSLSALGNCIAALAESSSGKRRHVPYRDSKLTRLLQDSLGGNAKTALIITVSDDPSVAGETFSTLQFGHRAKRVKVVANVNQVLDYRALYEALQGRLDKGDDQSQELRLEVQRLRSELAQLRPLYEDAERRRRAAEDELARLAHSLAATASSAFDPDDGAHATHGTTPSGTGDARGGAVGGDGMSLLGAADSAMRDWALAMSEPLVRAFPSLGPDLQRLLGGVVAQVTTRWQTETHRLREEHEAEVKTLRERHRRQVLELEETADAANEARNAIEFEMNASRDELLETLKEYRKTQSRLFEVEADLSRRVAELVAEVEELRAKAGGAGGGGGATPGPVSLSSTPGSNTSSAPGSRTPSPRGAGGGALDSFASLATATAASTTTAASLGSLTAEEATARLVQAEATMRTMVERVKTDFVSRARVEEMEALYHEAIQHLQERVIALETATPTSDGLSGAGVGVGDGTHHERDDAMPLTGRAGPVAAATGPTAQLPPRAPSRGKRAGSASLVRGRSGGSPDDGGPGGGGGGGIRGSDGRGGAASGSGALAGGGGSGGGGGGGLLGTLANTAGRSGSGGSLTRPTSFVGPVRSAGAAVVSAPSSVHGSRGAAGSGSVAGGASSGSMTSAMLQDSLARALLSAESKAWSAGRSGASGVVGGAGSASAGSRSGSGTPSSTGSGGRPR